MTSAVNQGETDIGLGLREAYHLMDGYSGRKMVVLISDGETDLARSDTGRTREDFDQDIAETICLLLFSAFKIYRKRKEVIVISEEIEEKSKYYFTGKLNAYFTLLPQNMQEIPPLTLVLHHIRDGGL